MVLSKKKVSVPLIWMTVYGDLITNLTLFFMLLFGTILMAMQRGLSKEQFTQFMRGVSAAVYQQEEKVDVKEIKNSMSKIKGISGIGVDDKEVRIILPETVLFDRGKAKMKEEAKALLSKVAAALPQKPNKIVVEGHTCNLPLQQKVPPRMQRWELALARSEGEGPFSSNWELSAARSIQIVSYFAKNKIVEPEILIAGSCGPSEPLFANDSEVHRAKNRRIEIKILYTK